LGVDGFELAWDKVQVHVAVLMEIKHLLP